MLELFLFLGDAVDDRPEVLVRERPLPERNASGYEQLAHFVPVVDGVVVALLKVADGQALQDFTEVDHRFRHVFGQDIGDALARFGDAHVEDVEQKDGIVGHGGATRFRNDVRVFDALLVEDGHDRFHDVGTVFVHRIVAAAHIVGVRAVVVHGEAAAEVEIPHLRAFLHEARIDAGALHDGGTDVADVGDLRTKVVVQELEAVEHVVLLQGVHDIHHLRRGQAEGGAFAAGTGPVAAALGDELDAHAEERAHAERGGAFEDQLQLAGHFHDENALEPHAYGGEAEVDELLVLVAVADEAGFRVFELGNGGNEFGFGTDFEAVVKARAELGDLLDRMLLLVHLNGEDAAVFALVAERGDGLAERLVQQGDLRIKNVFNAQQDRHVVATLAHTPNDLGDADGHALVFAGRINHDIALGRNAEVAGPPVTDAVQFGGIFHTPLLESAFYRHVTEPLKVIG